MPVHSKHIPNYPEPLPNYTEEELQATSNERFREWHATFRQHCANADDYWNAVFVAGYDEMAAAIVRAFLIVSVGDQANTVTTISLPLLVSSERLVLRIPSLSTRKWMHGNLRMDNQDTGTAPHFPKPISGTLPEAKNDNQQFHRGIVRALEKELSEVLFDIFIECSWTSAELTS
ncbi:hypothetical protein CONPUDRAFT_164677 [Coniophora puteana RWD-64-598 SS2]|uniref:Uncharacterized protein n=1 Tax=Coniophora puteana (strain RWD-64-598) TaxID=741705 RepID=A0A5M3MS55_CONPW|nr:uncharacterized protein CONPUDRAFT_164677 [Coniophora puteana RWD-64-598 SS2]EIW81983.1 hypothetical protein CONPUDRAFT_164677 [Coniophora puteana RWD-64-598 SS2]